MADEDDVAIAAVTAAELLLGVELADARHRPAREAFMRGVLGRVPVEDHDLEVARAQAVLLAHVCQAGRPRGAHDLVIAATSVARRRIVVTADRRRFTVLPGVAVRAGR